MPANWQAYSKAIVAFLAALAAALTAGTAGPDGLSGDELLTSLLGAAAAGLGVFTVPNRRAPD